MSARTPAQLFRTYQGVLNIFDDVLLGPNQDVSWTKGATLIDQLQVQGNSSGAPVAVSGFSVSAGLALSGNPGGGALPPFGKLGRIRAGMTAQTATSGVSGEPFTQNMLPLPPDQSLVAMLWDPASDNLPPLFSGALPNIYLAVAASVVFPSPVIVPSLSNVNIGIWMEPSLLSVFTGSGTIPTVSLEMANAIFSVTYDPVQQQSQNLVPA